LERARREPGTEFFAIEPSHPALVESASRARRERLQNLHYLLGSYEFLPGPLAGVATCVSVLFPWGSLLKAIAGGEVSSLANLAALCRPGASIEFVTAIDPAADAGELARLGMTGFSAEAVIDAWRSAGFTRVTCERLGADHPYQTTWWRKIRQRTERAPVVIRARAR
jgi:hypothetical protein